MLEQLTEFWGNLLGLFDSFPEDSIATFVYVIGTIIVLLCWYSIAVRLPKLLGGITWIVLFAILATPTVSDGTNAELAPAIFGVFFGVLTKEHGLIWANLSLIFMVMGVCLVIAFLWSKYRSNKSVSPL